MIGALIAAHDQFATYSAKVAVPLSPVRQMRERLLEDPSDPSWIRDGVRLCGRRGLLDEELARNIDAALANAPTAPNHGDLLLRNVIGDDEDDIVLVDWECAGTHLRDWDLALLWLALHQAATRQQRMNRRRRRKQRHDLYAPGAGMAEMAANT